MPRYEEENFGSTMRQKDIVLSCNEYCQVISKTNGVIKTYTGPITMTISAQESLVVFNPYTKRFEETADFEKARQLFTSAPEGWYVVLKNPAPDNMHPECGKAVNSPDLQIGKKINISGPCSFSLYPGQMTKVLQGHRLRSNQYLIARVYDADAATVSGGNIMFDAEGNEIKAKEEKYYVGQQIVIKGTEVSFYIPPTGIEIVPSQNGEYVRDAVTLERLEYAILKDENGEKTYKHGPSVVFPSPTQTFVESPKGGVIFRALELSPISGIYIKVIADYEDNKVKHFTGEELFITGKTQRIYYPRPEHALIQYDGKYMHHAIAIPKGEGRYILDRLSGDIKTVVGPAMYLPDPRTEVVVKRKLSEKECNLYYPGNNEVLNYNRQLSEKTTEKLARMGASSATTDMVNCVYSTANNEKSLAIFEANANISRGVSYTKPRTITLDTKFDGVVSIDVWTGYAISVSSKSGKREVVIGPNTKILDYDQTLETVNKSAFLQINNNRITDVVSVQTKDFVDMTIKLTYTVDFDEKCKDKWFSIENLNGFIINEERSLIKKEVKNYTVEEFINKSNQIIWDIAIGLSKDDKEVLAGRSFENGAVVIDVEIIDVSILDSDIVNVLDERNCEAAKRAIELAEAEAKIEKTKKLAEYKNKEEQIKYDSALYALELKKKAKFAEEKASAELEEIKRQEAAAAKKAEADLQVIIDKIEKAKRDRTKANNELELENESKLLELEKAKQKAYSETVAKIMGSISPDLVAAMTAKTNAELTGAIAGAVSPWSLANGEESISETVNRILRGSDLDNTIGQVIGSIKK